MCLSEERVIVLVAAQHKTMSRAIAFSCEVREIPAVRVERKATSKETHPVAELRERGTSFQQSSDIVVDHAFALDSDVTRTAHRAVASSSVDDMIIGSGVDFSSLLVAESNPTSTRVGPLTRATGGVQPR
jgi:hypothetical protein